MRIERSQQTDSDFCALYVMRRANLPLVSTSAQKALYFLAAYRVLLVERSAAVIRSLCRQKRLTAEITAFVAIDRPAISRAPVGIRPHGC
jgi:hypothetical protein